MNHLELTVLAQLSAHRELLVTALTYRFIQEREPLRAARLVQESFARSPTMAPPEGTALDPATSDLLAAMTDEAVEDVLRRVIERLDYFARTPRRGPALPNPVG
jgi:hypothetical protein